MMDAHLRPNSVAASRDDNVGPQHVERFRTERGCAFAQLGMAPNKHVTIIDVSKSRIRKQEIAGCSGQRFSGLLAWDSFFHFSPVDQRPMFARCRAHARPGAALMFTSGNEEGSAIGELEVDPLYHGSLGPSEYRALLDAAAFDVVADPTCGHRTIWLAQQRI